MVYVRLQPIDEIVVVALNPMTLGGLFPPFFVAREQTAILTIFLIFLN
jgi:hypothetical protein